MRGRQVCWSDPRVQRLAKRFVPATDEVWRLHNRQDPDCLFFQRFCEEGHYGGARRHHSTRQGIYCCTPSGRFLASINTTDPRRMERMLEEALEAWKRVPKKERYLDGDLEAIGEQVRRARRQFPEDGLALRVFSRDMPRRDLPSDWRAAAWNVDSMWFRADEARSLLPARLAKARKVEWPAALARRLVRLHLVDNVRGQTNGYRDAHVETARIEATVLGVRGGVATIRFAGESRATTTGSWPEKGRIESLEGRDPHDRGMQTTLVGEATYNVRSKRFVSFEITGLGTRWGQTRYNFRQDDLDETPIGFAIVLRPDDPGNRTAPAELGAYGW